MRPWCFLFIFPLPTPAVRDTLHVVDGGGIRGGRFQPVCVRDSMLRILIPSKIWGVGSRPKELVGSRQLNEQLSGLTFVKRTCRRRVPPTAAVFIFFFLPTSCAVAVVVVVVFISIARRVTNTSNPGHGISIYLSRYIYIRTLAYYSYFFFLGVSSLEEFHTSLTHPN